MQCMFCSALLLRDAFISDMYFNFHSTIIKPFPFKLSGTFFEVGGVWIASFTLKKKRECARNNCDGEIS